MVGVLTGRFKSWCSYKVYSRWLLYSFLCDLHVHFGCKGPRETGVTETFIGRVYFSITFVHARTGEYETGDHRKGEGEKNPSDHDKTFANWRSQAMKRAIEMLGIIDLTQDGLDKHVTKHK